MSLFDIFKKDKKNKKPSAKAKVKLPEKISQVPSPSIVDENRKNDESKTQSPRSEKGAEFMYRIIKRPYQTEKTSMHERYGKYSFVIDGGSNKNEVKKSIEKFYNVDITKINIIKKPAKKRRVGKHEGIKSGFKTAIVTLKKGQTIDIAAV